MLRTRQAPGGGGCIVVKGGGGQQCRPLAQGMAGTPRHGGEQCVPCSPQHPGTRLRYTASAEHTCKPPPGFALVQASTQGVDCCAHRVLPRCRLLLFLLHPPLLLPPQVLQSTPAWWVVWGPGLK